MTPAPAGAGHNCSAPRSVRRSGGLEGPFVTRLARASFQSPGRDPVPPTILTFESRLASPPNEVWKWITSVDGISAELAPIMKMTAPASMTGLADVTVTPGKRLFRSWVLLFGVVPIDRSDLTLLSIDPGKGFVEESPMLSMKLWRHERSISASGDGTTLTDKLTFEPRFARGAIAGFIRKVFEHRHRVLRARLG
jgi:ligand-binding SRPBCC domain-containing protein